MMAEAIGGQFLGAGVVLGQAGAGGSSGESNAALVSFAIYTLVVFSLAWFSHRVLAKRSFLSEYFLGSRGLGMLALALTFGATSASAGSFAGFPSLIYSHGWVLALWISSYMIFPLCGMGILGKRLNQVARRSGAITVPDVLRARFESRALALIGTTAMAFMLTTYLIPQFKLAAIIIRSMLSEVAVFNQAGAALGQFAHQSLLVPQSVEGPYLLALLMFAVLVIFYTTFGGFRAVVWTDILQGFVMVTGVLTMLVLVLWQVGGLSAATEKLAEMTPPRIGKTVFVSEEPAPEEGRTIPAYTWFTAPAEEAGESIRLLRTNQQAHIAAGETESNGVNVVRLTTPSQIERVREGFDSGEPPALPGDVQPRLEGMQSYAYGAGEKGVYVSAPGPAPDKAAGFLPLGLAVSFFVYWALSGTGQPNNMVRLMAFNRTATVKRAIAALSIYFGLIYFPLVIIFSCARILMPGLDQVADRIMPEIALKVAGNAGVPWLAGFLIAAPFAAAMSTVDGFMLMISSSVARDMYQRNINPNAPERTIRRLSYTCTVVVGLLAFAGAVRPPQFMQYLIVFAGGGLAVTFLAPVGLALYWPRFNTPGALASMVGGFGAYLSLYVVGFIKYGENRPIDPFGLQLNPLIWGFAASLLLALVVTLITAPPPEHLVRKFFCRRDEAGDETVEAV